ncbi:YHS domain-containing protein [Rhizobium laguerreae]
MHPLKTLEKSDGRGWIAPAKCGIAFFFLNSAILGSIALRLMLIEMVMGRSTVSIRPTHCPAFQAPPLSRRDRLACGVTTPSVSADVDNLLAERDIDVSFQAVSEWATKFGRWCETSERWRGSPLYEIQLAPSADPAWIDPVCKMHAPYSSHKRAAPQGPWFFSPRCKEAYRRFCRRL